MGEKNKHRKQGEDFRNHPLGVPTHSVAALFQVETQLTDGKIKPREYAFTSVSSLVKPYKEMIAPVLQDFDLTEDTELGILMCGTPLEERSIANKEIQWTLFVKAEWLRWILVGQGAGYKLNNEIPANEIYGQVPGWPDNFLEFLHAIVQSNTTFEWQRRSEGYLVLCQRS